MVRLGWATIQSKQTELTRIGRALLRALNSPNLSGQGESVAEIVFEPANPFAYAKALNSLASVRDAMLVEPYFRIEQLEDISEFSNIRRVLLGPGVKASERRVLAVGLAALEPDRDLEIRAAESLHDRYLIPADSGSVMMLGASLGHIGRKVSTLTTIGPEASEALRRLHEEIWKAATPLEPRLPASESSDATPIVRNP